MPIANRVSYVPNASFTGLDSFSYTVRDGNNATSTATITVENSTLEMEQLVFVDDSVSYE